MRHRVYAMEPRFLARLLEDRRDLLAAARELRTAEAMRAAKAEVMQAAQINLAPADAEQLAKSYSIDADGFAHIAVMGELTPKAQEDICGAYTAERLTEYGFIRAAAQAADADPRVQAIAFEVDSPGGYLDDLDQTAQVIAGLSKHTEARVSNMAASAAYWLASQTDRIVASSPADEIGSIGVATEWYDNRKALENAGFQRHVFTSSDAPNKRPDYATDEGRAQFVASLDATHSVFARRVAKGRRVSLEKVNKDFGRGGILAAEAALAAGMIDEVRGVSLERPVPAAVGSAAAEAAITDQERVMEYKDITFEALSKERPDLLAAAKQAGNQEGVTQGVAQERRRLEKLNAFRGINADGDKAVDEAIREGKSYEDAAALIAAATAKGRGREADGDNPPDVASAVQAAAGGVQMTPELASMAKSMGVTAADIAKFGGAPAKGKE